MIRTNTYQPIPSDSFSPHAPKTDVGLQTDAARCPLMQRDVTGNEASTDNGLTSLKTRKHDGPDQHKVVFDRGLIGAEHRVRTGDLRLGKATLYQLS
jgi:hypothetical protein